MPEILQPLILAEGTLETLAPHRLFPLRDPDSFWQVEQGAVDLFVVPMREGSSVGVRHHLFRAQQGDAILGLGPDPQFSLVFVAVGTAGTQLRQRPLSCLEELSRDEHGAQAAAAWLDRGILACYASLSIGSSPKKFIPLLPGQEQEVMTASAVMPIEGVVWVRHLAGSSRGALLGDPELGVQDGWAPVTSSAWLQCAEGAMLECQSTLDLILQGQIQPGLRRFGPMAMAWLSQTLATRQQSDATRLQERAKAQSRAVGQALSKLVGILAPATPAESTGATDPDQLLAACRMVGHELGLEFKAAGGAAEKHELRDPLIQIAQNSRVRFRRVVLSGDWWRRDGAPLLGFLEESGRPVALLPGRGGYELADPRADSRVPVTVRTMAGLSAVAYTFYRSFPQRALSLLDVAKFGFKGTSQDLRMLLGMGLLGGLLGLIIPITTGIIFDFVIPGAERVQLLQLALGLLMATVGIVLFQITRDIALQRLETKSDASIQAAVWDRLLTLPVPFFRDYTSGDLAMRVNGINGIRQIFSGAAVNALLAGVFSIFDFGLLFYYSFSMALVATALVAVSIGATLATTFITLRFQRPIYELQGKISGLVLQLITGISKLRVAGAESQAYSVWARMFAQQKKLDLKAGVLATALNVFNSSYPILTTMCLFAGLAFWSGVHMTTGAFLAFNVAFGGFLGAMLSMSSAMVSVLDVIPLYERSQSILKTLPEVDDAKADPGELSGQVEISHVCFRYSPDGPSILDDICCQIKPGEFVAIVGASGSGKSTLFRLLLGFESPMSGGIYYDGHDLASLDLHAVRRQFGVVLQNGKILPGSILENIIGNSLLTHEDAWDAARKAGLAEDIEAMPMQMHTVLGEGTSTLSGGQRQRLIIARAIVSRPRIILFDEATSALDNRTQAVVSSSLDHLQATRIVIAHRLSTIIHADRILVMKSGRLVQSGNYEELLRVQGPFAELAQRQMA